ncbi:hypothetical protein, partial [Pseudomonas monteilii]|uniref:hypothetical protein n=1 Tax=Pseudomonas monteilii TaxID=76759 RepID=UPI001E539BF4
SLNLKEFFVPTALEVVRIIRGFETASTPIFKKIRYLAKTPKNKAGRPVGHPASYIATQA